MNIFTQGRVEQNKAWEISKYIKAELSDIELTMAGSDRSEQCKVEQGKARQNEAEQSIIEYRARNNKAKQRRSRVMQTRAMLSNTGLGRAK